ncbi:hypothetical protein GQ600_23197 [Phytophthora cactorum]|nr:hypothetical protein GQ600_23197 [Phytophthora cactorum]
MPELANLRVETVEELENAIATVFEKALANEEFCDVYADIISLDNLYYSSLLGTPPHKIAGPFNIKTPPCNDLVLTKRDPSLGLTQSCSYFQDGGLLVVWEDEQQHKFYVSRPIVLNGPYSSRNQAPVLEMETGSGLDTEQLEHVKQRKEVSCRFLSALFGMAL